MNDVYIADISHHNPVKNWNAVKKDTRFLISKATEGLTYVDPTLDSFIQNCEAYKIPYWLYCFLRKGGELSQAKFMIETCKNKVGDCFVGYILDIEKGNAASDCKAAMNYIASQSDKLMIYTGYADYDNYESLIRSRPENCAWWEARYGLNDGRYDKKYCCHADADLHQFTSKGNHIGLAKGRTDLSRLTGKKKLNWFTEPLTAKSSRSGNAVTDLHVRTGPGTDFPVIGVIPGGTTVRIISTVNNSNGKPWNKITYKNKEGFVSGKYIK